MSSKKIKDSEIEAIVNEVSDEEEFCSESEDDIEYAESSDTSSDTDNENISTEELVSKNGQIRYSKVPSNNRHGRVPMKNVINIIPGVIRYASSRITKEEMSSLQLFFPTPVMNIILRCTNIEGTRVFGDDWTDIDDTEMFAFVGLLLLAGVYRSNNESTESLWHPERGRPIFGAIMPMKRFKVISRVIRFDNRDTRSQRRTVDKFAPIRELWNQWVDLLPKLYNPSEDVTIDEQLLAFRGRCPFRQYIPSKPAKYGIKFWVLCDAVTSYAWNIQPYTGKDIGAIPEKNQGMRVVLDLTTGLKGHNVTVDNFFTSYLLGQKLLEKHITLVGTIRKNKPELPSELVATKGRPLYSSTFCFTENTTLLSYIPKKNQLVLLLSTLHHSSEVSNREDKKPQIILDYNKCKGGVDTLDKVVYCYTCKRKTNLWPQVVFSNMVDISAYNAFILFTSINKGSNENCFSKRRHFLENVGLQLTAPYIKQRETLPRAKFSREIVKRIQDLDQHDQQPSTSTRSERRPGKITTKRRRCQLCQKLDNKTALICTNCEKFVCKEHSKTIVLCNRCNN